ncbi:MAG: outer membrane beta-barrel protein [Novosphingobium sp.]|nr:outer membrane beta-barrel protein [Novosphingobium sp.]
MRKIILTTAAALGATLAIAAPAQADEGRVEARGGVAWGYGDSKGVAGVAAGYDWDLGSAAFVGGEVSADKILDGDAKVQFGANARLGIKAGAATKVYATGGVSTKPASGLDETWNLGAGVQQSLGKMYIKAEYRHYWVNSADYNAVVGGVGFNF